MSVTLAVYRSVNWTSWYSWR